MKNNRLPRSLRSLAMTEAESLPAMTAVKSKETHPLAPSAREGGQNAKLTAREDFIDCHAQQVELAMTLKIIAMKNNGLPRICYAVSRNDGVVLDCQADFV